MFLGLVKSFASLDSYVGIVPELATRQAQGIIIREALLLRLTCPFQFGTSFLLPFLLNHSGLILLYSIDIPNVKS
jgi:hypothetical protein